MSNALQRVLTAVIGIPLVIGIMYAGGWWFGILVAAAAVLAQHEFYQLARRTGARPYVVAGLFAGGAVVLTWFASVFVIIVGATFVGVVLALPFTLEREQPILDVSVTIAGIVYPSLLLGAAVALRNAEGIDVGNMEAFWLTLTVVLMVWASDTFAYFTGRTFGKRPLAPQVSPKKTWEGTLGGAAGSLVVGIILAATPAVVAIMAWVMGDRLARIAWIGVLLTIGGVMLVNLLGTPGEDVARRPILGAVLIFLAVISEAAYTMFARLIAGSASPLGITSWYSLYGAIMFLPPALWTLRDFDMDTIPAAAWTAMIYMGAGPGALAVLLWFYGLRHVPASIAGAFTGVMPISAVLSAWLVLGEEIAWPHILGMVLIMIGIVMVARSRGRVVARNTLRLRLDR